MGQRNGPDPGRRRPALPIGLILCTSVALTSCGTSAEGHDHAASAVSLPASSDTASEQGSPPATASVTSSVHPVTTVVITDDPAVVAAGPSVEETWPGLLATRLGNSGSPLALTPVGVEGAGFAAEEPAGPTFTDLVVGTVSPSIQLVVFYDSRWDVAGAAEVRRSAEQAFSAVEEAAPDALIVLVGPWHAAPEAPQPDSGARSAVQAAVDASVVAVTYVDPVAEGWVTGASQQQIADLLLPRVSDLVATLARSGAFD